MTNDNPVRPLDVLVAEEVGLIKRALGEWIGPARCSDEFARAMGFSNFRGLIETTSRFCQELEDNRAIEGSDWRRILLAVELVFVSDLIGSGVDWTITTGLSDEYTIRILRSIQRKLVRVVRSPA